MTASSRYFNPHEREARDAEIQIKLSVKKILIHTSVKLVTETEAFNDFLVFILIHTSVKLVTCRQRRGFFLSEDFNPHEREARDQAYGAMAEQMGILIHTSVKLVTAAAHAANAGITNFNPHEREARDSKYFEMVPQDPILIHTSVKLVTLISGHTYLEALF